MRFRLLPVALLLLSCTAVPIVARSAGPDGGVTFSAIEGRLLRDGQPVRGATLVRQWQFDEASARGEDRATTGEDGRFSFPQVIHRYRKSRFLPQETVIGQRIVVEDAGKTVEVWVGSKRSFRDGDELQRSDDLSPTQGPLRPVLDLARPLVLRGRTVIRAGDAEVAR